MNHIFSFGYRFLILFLNLNIQNLNFYVPLKCRLWKCAMIKSLMRHLFNHSARLISAVIKSQNMQNIYGSRKKGKTLESGSGDRIIELDRGANMWLAPGSFIWLKGLKFHEDKNIFTKCKFTHFLGILDSWSFMYLGVNPYFVCQK